MLDASELRSAIRACLLSFMVISFLGGVMSGYGWISFGVFLCFFFWASYLIYFNEKFLNFIYTVFFTAIAFFALFCAVSMHFSYMEWWGKDAPGAPFIGVSIMLLFGVFLTLANLSKVRIQILEFKDNRVRIINSTGGKSQMGVVAVIGGVSALIAKSISGVIGPRFAITFCGIFFLYSEFI